VAKKSAAKKSTKKSAKKASVKKSAAKKTKAKKPAKKTTKKAVKKTAKKPAKKAKASAKKKTAAKKPAAKKSSRSAGKSSGKKASMTSKKSGKKASASRSAKVSGKGVLIRLKGSGAAAAAEPEERVKLRQVKATEKSKGETPITLHHRKPTRKEAQEFRKLLLIRRKQLMGDVDGLEAEAFSDETQHVSSNHLADSSFEQYEQEFNLSMIENETEELKEIARALEKIEQGTFGECEACGIDISIERLRVMPYTRICIHCRSKYEEEGGGEVYGVYPERRI
jgi:RNA polymerase-binding protein DksA